MENNPLNNTPAQTNVNFSIGIVRETVEPQVSESSKIEKTKEPVKTNESLPAFQEIKRIEHIGDNVNLSDEQFKKALERAFKAMDGRSTSIQFSIHEKTHQIMVKVMDKESGEVIREIPPEKSLDFLAKVQEMMGLFVDVRR